MTYLAYCVDKELYKAIDYLKEQVGVLVEQQKKQNKRILLNNNQRIRVASKAKRLTESSCALPPLFAPVVMRVFHDSPPCLEEGGA